MGRIIRSCFHRLSTGGAGRTGGVGARLASRYTVGMETPVLDDQWATAFLDAQDAGGFRSGLRCSAVLVCRVGDDIHVARLFANRTAGMLRTKNQILDFLEKEAALFANAVLKRLRIDLVTRRRRPGTL